MVFLQQSQNGIDSLSHRSFWGRSCHDECHINCSHHIIHHTTTQFQRASVTIPVLSRLSPTSLNRESRKFHEARLPKQLSPARRNILKRESVELLRRNSNQIIQSLDHEIEISIA